MAAQHRPGAGRLLGPLGRHGLADRARPPPDRHGDRLRRSCASGIRSPDALRTRPIDWLLALVAIYAVGSALIADTFQYEHVRFALLDRLSVLGFVLFFVAPKAYREERDRQILLGALVALGGYLGLTAVFEEIGPEALVVPGYITDPTVGHPSRSRARPVRRGRRQRARPLRVLRRVRHGGVHVARPTLEEGRRRRCGPVRVRHPADGHARRVDRGRRGDARDAVGGPRDAPVRDSRRRGGRGRRPARLRRRPGASGQGGGAARTTTGRSGTGATPPPPRCACSRSGRCSATGGAASRPKAATSTASRSTTRSRASATCTTCTSRTRSSSGLIGAAPVARRRCSSRSSARSSGAARRSCGCGRSGSLAWAICYADQRALDAARLRAADALLWTWAGVARGET